MYIGRYDLRRLTGGLSVALIPLLVVACSRPEKVDLETINADRAALQGKTLEVRGEVTEPEGHVRYIAVGTARYFVLTDGTDSINVWYDVSKLQCPPYPGSEVTVVGKIQTAGEKNRLVFAGRSLDIKTPVEPPEGTVRLCSLSFEESEIYAREGLEGLQRHWRQQGRPVFDVTTR